jgi:nucleoside transporter
MNLGVFARLCVMMFLNFFVWGSWQSTLGVYMERNSMADSVANAFIVHWAGAIVSPFLVGMIADRFFSTQVILGSLHLVGGILLLIMPSVGATMKIEGSHVPFLLLIFVHMICYMPTINLTTSLSFNNLSDSQKQFPLVRVFGTFGWIAAGLLVSFLGFDGQKGIFFLSGIAALALGLYCFTLPDTPPPAKGQKVSVRTVLGLDALVLLKDPSYLVFAISSFLICIPLSVYYGFTGNYLSDVGITNQAGTMTIGQMSEIFFMIAMPLFFVRLGVKWMIAVGMLAWVLRYAAFAIGTPDALIWIYIGIALHGICYDFFFVTGYIYTDKRAPAEIRSQAQGFLVWITLGWGMVIGSLVSKYLFNPILSRPEGTRIPLWHNSWWIQAGAAAVILVFFVLFFRPRVEETPAIKD